MVLLFPTTVSACFNLLAVLGGGDAANRILKDRVEMQSFTVDP